MRRVMNDYVQVEIMVLVAMQRVRLDQALLSSIAALDNGSWTSLSDVHIGTQIWTFLPLSISLGDMLCKLFDSFCLQHICNYFCIPKWQPGCSTFCQRMIYILRKWMLRSETLLLVLHILYKVGSALGPIYRAVRREYYGWESNLVQYGPYARTKKKYWYIENFSVFFD